MSDPHQQANEIPPCNHAYQDGFPRRPISRRGMMTGSFAALASLAVPRESSTLFAADSGEANSWNLYWGDIHNHNECGLAKGTFERAIELAQGHLDFWAATGHAWWHDMPELPAGGRQMFLNGFERHRKYWPRTRGLVQEVTDDQFCAILGYEWHSSEFGDYCLLFPEDNSQLYLPDHANKLLDFAEAKNALAIPHHVAYQRGWRGANFDFHRSVTSPVVEVMSEHGCSMNLSAPHDFVRHSMGGRSSFNTVDRQLASGLRFGFVGSSDSHTGYPGAYGEGVVGLWAADLSRESIFAAIRDRRTYATTGERITVEFSVNDQPMGADIEFDDQREIKVRVEGQDTVQSIELIKNGRVIKRHFPVDEQADVKLPGRAKCRVRYGWGPWAQFKSDRVALWEMTIAVRGGQIRHAYPCFQHAPYSEEMLDKVKVRDDGSLHLISPTARANSFEEDPTKSIVLDLEGPSDAEVVVSTVRPSKQQVSASLGYLSQDNKISFIGGFGEESFIIEKLVGPSEFGATLTWHDTGNEKGDWYYVHVNQTNGHQAWSSPIWVG